MRSHRNSHSSFRGSNSLPGRPFRFAALAMAALLVTGQISAETANVTAADSSTSASSTAAQPQSTAAPLPAAPAAPQEEMADLTNPLPDTPLALASRSDTAQNNAVNTPAAQPRHHGLAITGAVVGTLILLAGTGAFALSEQCKTPRNATCSAIHNGGIGMMAGGGAMAGTGFYFWFRK